MPGGSRICQECWTENAWDRRKYSLCCPRCNCDWERDFPGYVCIMQHVVSEDPGTDKWGWLLLVNYDSMLAIVIRFVEIDSSYSNQGRVCFDEFIWQGPTSTFIYMALLIRDPKFRIPDDFPEREALQAVLSLQHWGWFLDGVVSWAQLSTPDWSATTRRGSTPWAGTHFGLPKFGNQTPFARNLKHLYHQSQAATVIQAAWRGWKTRMSVLWNPHTVVGKRRLAAEADKETETEQQGLHRQA